MINFSKPDKPVLHLPYLEAGRFNQLQTRHWRPGEVYNHLRSISNDPGGVEDFLPCTKAHMIRRIYLWPHLPYLESQAFKLQQLYSFQFMDENSTYQAPMKVPKKLSYPLNSSRFKIIQAPPFQAKSPQSLQQLVSDFVSLEICFLSSYFMNVLFRSF